MFITLSESEHTKNNICIRKQDIVFIIRRKRTVKTRIVVKHSSTSISVIETVQEICNMIGPTNIIILSTNFDSRNDIGINPAVINLLKYNRDKDQTEISMNGIGTMKIMVEDSIQDILLKVYSCDNKTF